MTTSKKTYKKPELMVHGDVEKITLALGSGGSLDKDFPRKTPRSQLTFS